MPEPEPLPVTVTISKSEPLTGTIAFSEPYPATFTFTITVHEPIAEPVDIPFTLWSAAEPYLAAAPANADDDPSPDPALD